MTTEIRQELAALEDENGRLTAEAVLQRARNPKNPLHGYFTWDNKKAAEERRLDQARELIRSVKIRYETTHLTIKAVAYVRDPDAEPKVQGYRSLAAISKDENDARDTIVREFVAVAGHLARARQIAMALQLEGEVDDLVRRIDNLRGRLSTPPPLSQ